jgi:hypothetical protein
MPPQEGFDITGDIAEFIAGDPALLTALVDASGQVNRIFGTAVTSLALDLFQDAEEGWKRLFLIVRTDLPVNEAIQREDRLVEEWLAPLMDKVQGKLNVAVEPA